jgi:3-Oxoacyl-[acyl-carrier-protein (ACP)] synthase III
MDRKCVTGEVIIMFGMFDGNGQTGSRSGIGVLEGPAPRTRIVKSTGPSLRVKVASTAFYAPPRVETAAQLAPRIGRSEEWILTRTGVGERRIAEEPVEVMGARVARAALGSGDPPDLIVNASTTPRQILPDNSVFIQQELGFDGIPSYSVHATCLSFLVALYNASALVATGAYRRVLVVSAEAGCFTRNMSEPESAALLSDGAAAAVVEPTPEEEASELVGWRMSTWPKGATLTEIRGGGQRRYPNHPGTEPEDHLFSMDGPAVYRMARPRTAGRRRPDRGRCGLGRTAPGVGSRAGTAPTTGLHQRSHSQHRRKVRQLRCSFIAHGARLPRCERSPSAWRDSIAPGDRGRPQRGWRRSALVSTGGPGGAARGREGER